MKRVFYYVFILLFLSAVTSSTYANDDSCKAVIGVEFFKNSAVTKEMVFNYLIFPLRSDYYTKISTDGDEIWVIDSNQDSSKNALYSHKHLDNYYKIFRRVYVADFCAPSDGVQNRVVFSDVSNQGIKRVSATFVHEMSHHFWHYELSWKYRHAIINILAEKYPGYRNSVYMHLDDANHGSNPNDELITNEALAYAIQYVVDMTSKGRAFCDKEDEVLCMTEKVSFLKDVAMITKTVDSDYARFLARKFEITPH